MSLPICPHCGKVTEGEIQDKDIFLMVICEECHTILGVLPKYFQKCTWKRTPSSEDLEGEDAPAEVGVKGENKARNEKPKRWD